MDTKKRSAALDALNRMGAALDGDPHWVDKFEAVRSALLGGGGVDYVLQWAAWVCHDMGGGFSKKERDVANAIMHAVSNGEKNDNI